MNAVIIKRNIHYKQFNIYVEKFVQKHLNFIQSVKTIFCLTLKNFLRVVEWYNGQYTTLVSCEIK